jgi:hypothetical protein
MGVRDWERAGRGSSDKAGGDAGLRPGDPPSGMMAAATEALGGGMLQRKLARRLVQRSAAGPAPGGRQGPKKTATPDEVKAIQALIDQALQAEHDAASLEEQAAALRAAGDPQAAARERQAHQKRLAARGFKQQAINLAVTAYGIDSSHVKKLLYDDSEVDSETDERSVSIGRDAFRDPGWLGSTIAHEVEEHVNQQDIKGHAYEGDQGRRLNEIEAYDHEITNAPRFGLTREQVAGLRRNRQHYLDGLDRKHQERRLKGDYTMEPGHEED